MRDNKLLAGEPRVKQLAAKCGKKGDFRQELRRKLCAVTALRFVIDL